MSADHETDNASSKSNQESDPITSQKDESKSDRHSAVGPVEASSGQIQQKQHSHEETQVANHDHRIPSTIREEDKLVLRDKMKDMFTKMITDIDKHVLDVGESQCELDSQLDRLIETLDSIKIDEKLTADISENAKRISSLKSRLTVIHTILNDSSSRCSRTLAACGSVMNMSTIASTTTTTTTSQPSTNSSSPTRSLKKQTPSSGK